jgi:hypothetical protein
MNTSDANLSELADSCVARLLEHCDAVQIMMTGSRNGGDQCWSLARGGGNWYARQGLAHEFITSDVAMENARQIGMVLPRGDD